MEKQAGWKQRKTKHIDKICKNFKVKTLLFNLQTKFSVSSLPCSKRAFNLVFSSVALIGDKITITEPKWVKVWAKHSVERVKLKWNSYSRCARPRVTSFFFFVARSAFGKRSWSVWCWTAEYELTKTTERAEMERWWKACTCKTFICPSFKSNYCEYLHIKLSVKFLHFLSIFFLAFS